MTLSVVRTIQRRIIRRSPKNLKGCEGKPSWPNFWYYLRICLEGLKKCGNPWSNSQSLDRDWNPELPDYYGVLSNGPRCSIYWWCHLFGSGPLCPLPTFDRPSVACHGTNEHILSPTRQQNCYHPSMCLPHSHALTREPWRSRFVRVVREVVCSASSGAGGCLYLPPLVLILHLTGIWLHPYFSSHGPG
jgi:hypothetical protein